MKIVVVAAGLLLAAGVALGASLVPAGHVTPVSVSLAVPGAPLMQVPARAAPALTRPATVNSIARSADTQAETAPPVIPAPALVNPPPPAGGLQIVQIPQCWGHGNKKQCPPSPSGDH